MNNHHMNNNRSHVVNVHELSQQDPRYMQYPRHVQYDHTSQPPKPSKKQIFSAVMKSRVLDLHDSVARDYLANERTFLSWIRTGFATSALGIVIAKLQLQGTNGISETDPLFFKILSIAFIIIGILCIVTGSYRYALVAVAMEQGTYPTSGIAVALVAIIGLVAFGATLIMLLI